MLQLMKFVRASNSQMLVLQCYAISSNIFSKWQYEDKKKTCAQEIIEKLTGCGRCEVLHNSVVDFWYLQ